MKIAINKKTGFRTNALRVDVYDHAGRFFYWEENTGDGIYFNLPPGVYETSFDVIATVPREYDFIKLPKPNNPRPLKPLRVRYGVNPNICSVDLDTGDVFADNSFLKKPQYVLDFVIGHEQGHFFFNGQKNLSERLCDQFSYNLNLAKGYNPYQLQYAQDSTLSRSFRAFRRRDDIGDAVKTNYKN